MPHPIPILAKVIRDQLARLLAGQQANRLLSLSGLMPYSSANAPAISAIVDERCAATRMPVTQDPIRSPAPLELPAIDLSVVTHNSQRWVAGFVTSLIGLDYPKARLTVRFVDNKSSDATLDSLEEAATRLRAAGAAVEVLSRPNRGFGAGHNAGLRQGTAPFVLVTNIDLTFEPDALMNVVAIAVADQANAAAWELHQKPYEHPKFYDPVTGTTNWNSHACVLLRRRAIEEVGGYDEALFMYGEDVELSYRLRRHGCVLRYCPRAVVWHHTYEQSGQIKPLQYTGSTFANLYLRLKYGTPVDALAVVPLAIRLLAAPEPFEGARQKVLLHLVRLAGLVPVTWAARRPSEAHFPFRAWDYELTRDGAFVKHRPLPADPPLVSVITRTYKGRELYLRQALLSVAHQTWPNLEHIVVEDGGDSQRKVTEEIGRATGRPAQFHPIAKAGRSAAGNVGLAKARGRWCVFLDDDDLLFADHVEVLANALLEDPAAAAAYSPSWEVVTGGDGPGYVETMHRVPAVLRQEFDFEVLRHHNFMPIQSVLFERRLFEERGGFDEDMDSLEDWTLWIRYAFENRFVHVPKLTSMFRTPADATRARDRLAALDAAYPAAVARAALRVDTLRRAWVPANR